MALPDLRPKLTYEDYVLFPEDGMRHEILDGDHYVTASPFVRHQRISGRIYRPLSSWVEDRGLGEVFYASVDVVLSTHDVAVPDLLYISKQRSEIITEKNIQGAPDLIVEIISPGTRLRDEGIKFQSYSAYGVEEYWMVYPDRRAAKIYRRKGGRLGLAADVSAAAGDVLTTPLLPGLAIPLAEIF